MRWVTAKPPAMLMLVIRMAKPAVSMINLSDEEICSRAPMTMMLLMA